MTDTAAKRFAMMNLGRMWINDPPVPDGAIGEQDRLRLLSLYVGPFAEPPTPALRRVLHGAFGGSLSALGVPGGSLSALGRLGGNTRIRGH